MAIRSIIYLNYEAEPLAFDNTGAPLHREVRTYISLLCSLQNSNVPTFRLKFQLWTCWREHLRQASQLKFYH